MSISSQICPTALLWTTSRNAITGDGALKFLSVILSMQMGFCTSTVKNPEFLKQEIYANLTLYNFGIFIANEAAEENKKKERKNDNKYLYEIDISSALKTARKFFIRRDSDKPIDIIKLMLKYVHAVKEKFRQFDRPLRGISAIHFGYR